MKAYVDGEEALEDIGKQNSGKVRELLKLGTLCSDGSIQVKGKWGCPACGGILQENFDHPGAWENGMDKQDLNKRNIQVSELPF